MDLQCYGKTKERGETEEHNFFTIYLAETAKADDVNPINPVQQRGI
jgi:hypothetical protein